MPDEPTPQAIQLELGPPFFSMLKEESRTLDLFDAIPKYPFARTQVVDKPTRIKTTFESGNESFTVEIVNAQIKDRKTGAEVLVFPGSREDLVERALRYLSVQQIAPTKKSSDPKTGHPTITVMFSLSQIRRHLEYHRPRIQNRRGSKKHSTSSQAPRLPFQRARLRAMDGCGTATSNRPSSATTSATWSRGTWSDHCLWSRCRFTPGRHKPFSVPISTPSTTSERRDSKRRSPGG